MQYSSKKLEKSQIEITITVTPEECRPHLEKAAQRISVRTAIKGFRPGKAPYDIVKREAGEMAILQEALESIIQKTFFHAAITEEKLETIGMPKIDVDKIAPGNDLVYRAVVAVLPLVNLPDLKKIKVEKKEAKIDAKKVEETLDALRGMRAKEVIKQGPAQGTDKLTIDMDMLIDNVPVEGGQAKNYHVYLGESHYIPGFNEQVKGMKEGEEREFQLDFPVTHYQKHLAGRRVNFKVKAKGVYERQLPELDEEFAKTFGQENVEKLRALVNNNLLQEAEQKIKQQTEIDILEQLIANTEFGDLPEVLIDSERQKMFYELKRDLERNGVSIEQYLQDIKKGEKELFEDFKNQAEKRAKAALISRQVAKEQNIIVSDEELDKEVELIRQAYANDKDTRENLKKPKVRESLAVTVQNRKIMEYLRAAILSS
ncbi:MAG: trigger factor [Patescibacteria group bacterium]